MKGDVVSLFGVNMYCAERLVVMALSLPSHAHCVKSVAYMAAPIRLAAL